MGSEWPGVGGSGTGAGGHEAETGGCANAGGGRRGGRRGRVRFRRRWTDAEGRSAIGGGERGTVSVEFVGVLPAVLLAALISAQVVLAGYALWSASVAARAGARAAHTGGAVEAAVRGALPGHLRHGAEVSTGGLGSGRVAARVPVPRALPFLPGFRVEAKSALEPGGG